MGDRIWALFGVMVAGQLVWLVAAASAEKWLRDNDPEFKPPGFAARFFLGRLFTSFGPMMRYRDLRRERGESTTLTSVFWVGFAVSIAGVIGILASLG